MKILDTISLNAYSATPKKPVSHEQGHDRLPVMPVFNQPAQQPVTFHPMTASTTKAVKWQ